TQSMRRTLSLLKGDGIASADINRTPGACRAPTADVTSRISTPGMAVLLDCDGRTLAKGFKSRATAWSPGFLGTNPFGVSLSTTRAMPRRTVSATFRSGHEISRLPGTQGSRRREPAATDVTATKRGEEALREVPAELAHVSRVATLGALTGSIATRSISPLVPWS